MKEEKNDTKKIILTSIAAIILLTVVIGATFAFFTAQTGTGKSASIKADTATTDSLKFEGGKTLTINATQQNFGQGAGNESDDTTVKATLLANNNTNQASENYYVYLDITENSLKYTTEDKQAELLLQVTGPAGEVTSIPGLNYVTSGGESGFDITEAQDLITIADQYLIESTGTEEHVWTIRIVLVNLDSNQQGNTEKAFIANVKIQKEKKAYHEKCNDTTLACHIAKTVTTDVTLILHNAILINGANDDSYRYAGASDSVNNYVCFGSDAATCPEENLYRIIGVFGDQVKIIKATAATSTLLGTDGAYDSDTSYYWDRASDYNNTWSHSLLNTINLNTNFLNNIGSGWTNKIATTTWKVGGMSYSKKNTAKQYYDVEVGTSSTNIPYSAKIGLMYISDYGYAASQEHWTKVLYEYNDATTSSNNWMYLGTYEWTISRNVDNINDTFRIHNSGSVNIGSYDPYDIRPVFFLESAVNYVSGSGMASDPIRIS